MRRKLRRQPLTTSTAEPPPSLSKKKQKVTESSSDVETLVVSDGDWEREREKYEKYGKEIVFYRMYEPVDITHAMPILFDPKVLEELRIQLPTFCLFINSCLNKYTFQIYDHPGDPRFGGFFHEEGEYLNTAIYRDVTESAFEWYQKNVPEGSTMQLKEVAKMSCSPDSYRFYYFTLIVADKVTGFEKTLQAQLMELDFDRYQFGMLRDVTHDRVLGAIRFTERDTATTIAKRLNDKWKKEILGIAEI